MYAPIILYPVPNKETPELRSKTGFARECLAASYLEQDILY